MTAPALRRPANPWLVALGVLWATLLVVALVLLLQGSLGDVDPDPVLLMSSAALAAIAIVVVGLHLAARALLWHLDPSVRYEPAAAVEPRPARQDF